MDTLVDALWPDAPPRTARKNIQVYVSALRSLLGPADCSGRISHQLGGYAIHVHPAELDSLRFEQQTQATQKLRHGGQEATVAGALAAALELWRGPVLDGMRDVPLVEEAAQRLDRQFRTTFEDWAEAEVAAGGALGAIERITEVADRHPFRERLRIIQMTALAQAGRRSEALAVYDELRQALAQEFGLTLGAAVTRCYQSLLSEGQPVMLQPARTPPSRAASCCLLPRKLASFTGRGEYARHLGEALSGGERLAVLTGPVGAGKTALAVHVAHQLGDRFPDGRFFIRMREEDGPPRPAAEVFSELMWAIDLPGWTAQGGDARTTWQRWLAGRQALIVLDDARSESEVRPFLPEVGESAVIVTARPQLSGLVPASHLRVPCFTTAEALEFLGRVIGPGRVAADPSSAERIVAATGLLPLGLWLVAQRLALLRHLPLQEYLARMDSAPSLLDELTAGDVAIRSRLAQAIADLPRPARRAFPRLGHLHRLFTVDEAAEVLGLDRERAGRLLEALLAASIVAVPDAETVAHAVIYETPVLTYRYAQEIAAAHLPSPASARAASGSLPTARASFRAS